MGGENIQHYLSSRKLISKQDLFYAVQYSTVVVLYSVAVCCCSCCLQICFPLAREPVSRRTRALALLNRVTDPNTHISYHATLRISYFYIYPIIMGWSVDKVIVFYYATLMHPVQCKCMSLLIALCTKLLVIPST